MTTNETLNVNQQVDAIERSLDVQPGTIGPKVTERISRVYATDAADLWDAVTNPERLPRWFAQVDGDLRLGGQYQVQNNAGGTIERCEPPRLFEATWEFMGGMSWVLVAVDPVGAGKSRLTLEHRGEVPDEFWKQFGPGATGVGWDLGFFGLSVYLETGRAIPVEESDWFATTEAKEFIAGSSARWGDAAIGAGMPEAEARAAEAATTAFFTGAG